MSEQKFSKWQLEYFYFYFDVIFESNNILRGAWNSFMQFLYKKLR